MRITYTGLASGVTTERDIEPWSVFSTLGNWYVRGHCRRAGDERVFRIDRIRAADATGARFDPPAEVPPPVVRYLPGEEDVRAVIKLSARARWVADYYPVDVIEETADGGTVVRFSAGDPAVVARLLVRLGPDAELESGAEVEAALVDLRGRILGHYAG